MSEEDDDYDSEMESEEEAVLDGKKINSKN